VKKADEEVDVRGSEVLFFDYSVSGDEKEFTCSWNFFE
jgi:hypothetical protein